MPRHPSSFHYPYLCNVAYRYLIPNAFNSFIRNLFTTGNADFRGLNTEHKLRPTVTNNRFLIVYVTVLPACAV